MQKNRGEPSFAPINYGIFYFILIKSQLFQETVEDEATSKRVQEIHSRQEAVLQRLQNIQKQLQQLKLPEKNVIVENKKIFLSILCIILTFLHRLLIF